MNIHEYELYILFYFRLHPIYTQAMNNLGNLLKDHGELIKAQRLFEKAVEVK